METGTLLLGVAATKYFFFLTTHPDTFVPVTLAGTPSLAANINGGAAVTAGLTLSVDHGSITGRHRVAIDVDNATLALADGDDLDIYLAAGTVGGYSVVGAPLATYECSDGSLHATTLADINAEVDTAIGDAALVTKLDTIDDLLDTEVAAILAAVDTEVAAIKAKTDSLTFTVAGQVDANVQAINDVALTGDGSVTPFGV